MGVHSATLTKTDVLFNIAVHLDIRIQNDRFMTFRKMISSIWNAYLRVLSKYPMGTQIVQTGSHGPDMVYNTRKSFWPSDNFSENCAKSGSGSGRFHACFAINHFDISGLSTRFGLCTNQGQMEERNCNRCHYRMENISLDSNDQFLLRSIPVEAINSQYCSFILVHFFGMVC